MAKVIIEIDDDYFEILKYEVRNGNDFLPIKIIANGTLLSEEFKKLKTEIEKLAYFDSLGKFSLPGWKVYEIIDNRILELKGE